MKSPKLTPIAGCLALALASSAQAQQLAALDPLLVTATRTETRSNALLSDVTVVTREEIQAAPQTSLPEFLGSLPGVQFVSNGGRGASGSLFLRGSNSDHSVVLVDGQRISSATLGTTAVEHIPMNQIDRIEIVRGPASALYGADAIGGVIQIFTRKGSGAPAANFSVEYGRYNTSLLSGGYGGQIGETRFDISAGIESSRAFSTYRNASGGLFDPYNSDRDPYRNLNLNGQLSHRFSERFEAGAQFFHVEAKKHFDGSNCDSFYMACTSAYDNRLRQQLDSAAVYARYRALDNWTTQIRFGQSQDKMRSWRLDPVATQEYVDRYVTRQDQLTWQNDVKLGRYGQLMAAYEWRQEAVDSTQPFTVHRRTGNAAILGYQNWLGPHSLQLSARHDDIEGFSPRTSGNLAYGYEIIQGLRARAALGTAFHVPTFNQLYWPVDLINFYQGNPNLQVERAYNREVGLSYERDAIKASLTAYYNKVDNLLNYVPGTASSWIGQYENIGQATLKGATFVYSQIVGQWQVKGTYDYLDARDDATDKVLQRRVPHSGNLSLTYCHDLWSTGVQLQAFSAHYNDSANTQRLGGYLLTNIYADYRLKDGWSVFTRVNNLFDRHYVALRDAWNGNDYSVPGISLFVGIRYAP